MAGLILLAIIVPIVWGVRMLAGPAYKNRKAMLLSVSFGLAATTLLSCAILFMGDMELHLFALGENMEFYFHVDKIGRIFMSIVTLVFPLVGVYAFEYMGATHSEHGKPVNDNENQVSFGGLGQDARRADTTKHSSTSWSSTDDFQNEKRFFGFYLMVYGVLLALGCAGNMVTFYLFYEMMSLFSMPLVFHLRTREAVMAGLKYLFYSLCGAYFVLFGIYFLNQYTTTLNFTAGGTLDMAKAAGNEGLLLVAAMSMIFGFGVKAGMVPMHAWLPTAHPIAPAPASAALSSIIVKMGVFGVMRVVYCLFGVDFLRGTWVQTVWLTLTLITIFLGSMLAYREKVFKKRLAYSTVSQVSYILFGMALMHPQGLTGSLLHILFHAVIKSTLFMTAGAIICKCGIERVDQMRGIGKKMPKVMWCYTLCSLALIGIPPASGFISKWYLAIGSLNSEIAVFSWLGPVVLLVSALLTAGYLLPISIDGFFVGAEYYDEDKKEPTSQIVVPMMILAGFAVALGVFPNFCVDYISELVNLLF